MTNFSAASDENVIKLTVSVNMFNFFPRTDDVERPIVDVPSSRRRSHWRALLRQPTELPVGILQGHLQQDLYPSGWNLQVGDWKQTVVMTLTFSLLVEP